MSVQRGTRRVSAGARDGAARVNGMKEKASAEREIDKRIVIALLEMI